MIKKRKLSLRLLFACFALFPLGLFAQKTFTISGFVEDSATTEKLLSVAIYEPTLKLGVVTNNYGFYSLTLPKGEVTLAVSYVGYQPRIVKINLDRDIRYDMKLADGIEIQTVEVKSKRQGKIEEQVQGSRIVIPIEQLKKIPALMGEVDVLKVLQLLPGVQSGSEGQNGLYVRGGSPDQNLILLDGVPIYNVSHLGGFFSTFNGDAIKDVSLIKGGFPARYGGRLSSVIEIETKDGNMKEFHGEGGIGLIASRLTLEGPIVKNKASFMVSARRTYLDVLLNPAIKKSIADGGNNTKFDLDFYFYDLNAKLNWKINAKNRLFFSIYNGLDKLGLDITEYDNPQKTEFFRLQTGFKQGNLTSALRWNYLVNDKLFMNTTLMYTRFGVNQLVGAEIKNDAALPAQSFSQLYTSSIFDWSGRIDFDYLPNPNHRFRFGLGETYHTYKPGATQVKFNFDNFKRDTTLGDSPSYSNEIYLYGEDEMKLGKLKINGGLHWSGFLSGGKFFNALQPRVSLNYPIAKNTALKASFATMQQYVNLLNNDGIGIQTELWVPSTNRIRPQSSWQAVLGAAQTLGDGYECSFEAYYKDMKNVLAYQEGVSFFGRENQWQDKVVQGNGRAYGMEFFVQKKEGDLTGWIGYTLSWNKRTFSELNNGIEFPFQYDRRHDFKSVLVYKLTPKWSISGSWQYGTGNAITLRSTNLPAQLNGSIFEPLYASNTGERNLYRMSPYHRLDLSAERERKHRWGTSKWIFSIYNAYNRPNPYTLLEDSQSASNGVRVIRYRQLSLFPIIPTTTWAFKF